LEVAVSRRPRTVSDSASCCLRLWLLTAAHVHSQTKSEDELVNNNPLNLPATLTWVKQHILLSDEFSQDSEDSISPFRAHLLAMSLLVLSDLVCLKQAAVEVTAALPVWVHAAESLVSGSLTRAEESPSAASILLPALCRLACILATLSTNLTKTKNSGAQKAKTPKHFFSESDVTKLASSLGRTLRAAVDSTDGGSVDLPAITSSLIQKSLLQLERASLTNTTLDDDDGINAPAEV
jgi:hypothetical protein